MPDFKKMYFKLAGSYADAIAFMDSQSEIMKTILRDMEEYYISCEDKEPILIDGSSLPDCDITGDDQFSHCEFKDDCISEI